MAAFLNCVPFGTDIANLLGCLIGCINSENLVKISAAAHEITMSERDDGCAACLAYMVCSPPAYMEPSSLIGDELVSPSSSLSAFVEGFFELGMLIDGKEMISRMLRTGESSLMIGRNKGKQAPTMPSEDSTIGQ